MIIYRKGLEGDTVVSRVNTKQLILTIKLNSQYMCEHNVTGNEDNRAYVIYDSITPVVRATKILNEAVYTYGTSLLYNLLTIHINTRSLYFFVTAFCIGNSST